MQNLAGRCSGVGLSPFFRRSMAWGAFAIAMHTRCGAWSALQGMLVRRMHASRSGRVAGLIICAVEDFFYPLHMIFPEGVGCDL
jgi:hypothetical protein